MGALTDAELLERVGEGDEHALGVLFERHADWLAVRLQRRCADAHLVDEVVADTFVRAWRKAHTFRGDSPVGAWLWGIARRRLADATRRRPRGLVTDAPPDVADRRTVEDEVVARERRRELADAVGRLSPRLRRVAHLVLVEQRSTREVARRLDIPEGTVKTRAMRARAALRRELR